jgi:glucosamine-6-phosphate deaminase
MRLEVYPSKTALAQAAAQQAQQLLVNAIREKGSVRLIAATGASQLGFLEALTSLPGIDWEKVEMFHLDEYIGMSEEHPASFRRYLRNRLIEKVGIRNYHLLDGTRPPAEVMAEVGAALQSEPIDVAFVGVGENGHLAFNDPPADFTGTDAYTIVTLDQPCRQQQFGEGWFATIDDVPHRAISMTVRQIMASTNIVAVVPDARKAQAVKDCLEGEVSPMHPASILREHPNTTLYLDPDSAAKLSEKTIETFGRQLISTV